MPVAVPVACDINTLLKTFPCFTCLSEKQCQAVLVYLLDITVAALQGTPIQTVNQLRSAVTLLAADRPSAVCDDLDLTVARAGAQIAGAPGASQTIAQIMNASKGFANTTLTELRAMEVLLRCQINAFL